MHRKTKSFPLTINQEITDKCIAWASKQSNRVAFLFSSEPNHDPWNQFKAILAVDAYDELICNIENGNAFDDLKRFIDKNKDWTFGFFSYDLKNQLETLHSSNFDGIQMPLMHFFCPRIILFFTNNNVEIAISHDHVLAHEHNKLLKEILATHTEKVKSPTPDVLIKQRVSKDKYIATVEKIKDHIKKGDIYEANYCIEFYADKVPASPELYFHNLIHHNASPFSVFYQLQTKFLIGSSPERFLAKRGNKLISQPIKGTIKRGSTSLEDAQLKEKLHRDPKERSENVMIVDIVRNDLSRVAAKGSVQVSELCGIYTYPRVHQMISTVECQLDPLFHITDALRCAFPMGSMTGAPKIRAMELMELYEDTRRGLYSGAVGYITPDLDFDFNVVIRSILYNENDQYLSFMAGSAITILSDSINEYNECLLKASAMKKAISGSYQ